MKGRERRQRNPEEFGIGQSLAKCRMAFRFKISKIQSKLVDGLHFWSQIMKGWALGHLGATSYNSMQEENEFDVKGVQKIGLK